MFLFQFDARDFFGMDPMVLVAVVGPMQVFLFHFCHFLNQIGSSHYFSCLFVFVNMKNTNKEQLLFKLYEVTREVTMGVTNFPFLNWSLRNAH